MYILLITKKNCFFIPKLFLKKSKKRQSDFVLTKVNGFAFCLKIYYLCSTNVETPRQAGFLHVFYAKNVWEIGEIIRHVGKIVSIIRKIVSNLVKNISIIRARKSFVIYKTSSVNVNVC